MFFVPKTPRYLVMEGNDSKALYVLERINGPEKAKKIFADIKSVTAEKTEKALYVWCCCYRYWYIAFCIPAGYRY